VVEEKGRHLAGELGDSALFCRMDVTDETSVRAAIRSTVDRFGAVHAAISCAGVATPGKVLGKEGPMDIQSFNRVVQINLVGTMNVIRFAAEQMVRNPPNEDGERGVLINTASIAGYEGQIGQAAYASSKAGVIGVTLPIARELAQHGIRVVTIAPGMFETPMMAGMSEKVRESLLAITLFPKRLGKPAEFARLVAHIIDNPMLNGECIRLDGGVRMGAK
jgi:NAD(P)-dependent dehydrogenase (short-subunit alcohol dehydrogenase family)